MSPILFLHVDLEILVSAASSPHVTQTDSPVTDCGECGQIPGKVHKVVATVDGHAERVTLLGRSDLVGSPGQTVKPFRPCYLLVQHRFLREIPIGNLFL